MSHSIMETDVTKKMLHLELTYRTSSVLGEEEDDTAELEVPTGLVPARPVRASSGEFACLLSLI
jgi:hypothetical protein